MVCLASLSYSTRKFQMILLIFLMISLWVFTSDAEVLNDHILDYQPLNYNPHQLTKTHERAKQNTDPYLKWTFQAYGRTFNLHLKPAVSMFAPDHKLVMGDTRDDYVDTSHIYEGILAGYPASHVHMSVLDGSVLGFINIPGDMMYHMEPSDKYFKNAPFPSIIYPESKVNMEPFRRKKPTHKSNDGRSSIATLYDKLRSVARHVDDKASGKTTDSPSKMNNSSTNYTGSTNNHLPIYRQKRDTKVEDEHINATNIVVSNALPKDKNTCYMSLRADKLLYQHISEQKSEEEAKKFLLSMFANHISSLNCIFGPTKFKFRYQDTPYFSGIRFRLQQSTIIQECNSKWPCGYCLNSLKEDEYLDLTSRENHDDYCLVHTFTYREFVGGELGLAWTAEPDGTHGVCGVYSEVEDDKGEVMKKSLNTGITTLLYQDKMVASRVSQLTFAHEVAHNFGSAHDETSFCAPHTKDGNYLMYGAANDNFGRLHNNYKFSECSKDSIASVLQAIIKGKRHNCFKSGAPDPGFQVLVTSVISLCGVLWTRF